MDVSKLSSQLERLNQDSLFITLTMQLSRGTAGKTKKIEGTEEKEKEKGKSRCRLPRLQGLLM